MEAERRLELLAQPAAPQVIDAAALHTRQLYLGLQPDGHVNSIFEKTVSDLRQHGTMTADVQRAWRNLRRRVVSPGVAEQLDGINETLVVGACSGSEVSTATFAFADGSYLILMDQGLATLTWLAAQLYATTRTSMLAGLTPSAESLAPEAAARTLRLGVTWLAVGGRPGKTPPLALSLDEIVIAGHLSTRSISLSLRTRQPISSWDILISPIGLA
jgi:hypothetical protein